MFTTFFSLLDLDRISFKLPDVTLKGEIKGDRSTVPFEMKKSGSRLVSPSIYLKEGTYQYVIKYGDEIVTSSTYIVTGITFY